jgi:hypothetical protein
VADTDVTDELGLVPHEPQRSLRNPIFGQVIPSFVVPKLLHDRGKITLNLGQGWLQEQILSRCLKVVE